jgi:hypothetical protein
MEDELPAIMYAQIWTYTKGRITPEIRQKVVKAYGEKGAYHIEAIIKRANFASLCSNTIHVVGNNWRNGKRDLKSSASYLLCLPLSKLGKMSELHGKK